MVQDLLLVTLQAPLSSMTAACAEHDTRASLNSTMFQCRKSLSKGFLPARE